ncbi:hypothetical protein ACLB2K_051336 [Fragaria x ananassa]
MALRSKLPKSRIEDRISGLPDAILCHKLSFCTTREAVQTNVLSHRWKNVWSSVPILDLDEQKYHMDYVYCTLPLRYVSSSFAQFVNGLLSLRSPINIHRFHLKTTMTSDASLIYDWSSTTVKHNVVELDLCVETPTEPHFEIPRNLFLCNTLVSLKLLLSQDVSAVTPGATCFPCLNADAPNLEELDIYYDFLVSYSVKDAKYLRKAKIDFLDVDELDNLHCFLGLAGRVRRLFAGIINVTYLSVSAAILGVLDIRDHHLLSTLNDLKHLVVQVETCYCLQSLPTLLNLSPNLEHLEFENTTKFCADDNEDEFVHGWDAPELVPVCLFSHLKTICLREIKGCPNEMARL